MKNKKLSSRDTIRILALANDAFREFTSADWDMFAGCEHSRPLLAYVEFQGGEYTVLLDGRDVQIFVDEVDVDEDGEVIDHSMPLVAHFSVC